MNIIIDRFISELERYKKENAYSSIEKIIEVLENQYGHHYNREDFSRFKSGQRKFKDVDLKRFSELFKVRKEYLSGLDNFRTEDDKIHAEKANRNLLSAFHKIFVALGYADCSMDNIDYNITFPSNTKAFIESIKVSLKEQHITLLCDVNADNLIYLSQTEYELFIAELTDFIEFKLTKLFMSKEVLAVPTVVLEDNSTLLHPNVSIPLKDGTTLLVDMKYTPTSELTDTTLANFIKITEQ